MKGRRFNGVLVAVLGATAPVGSAPATSSATSLSASAAHGTPLSHDEALRLALRAELEENAPLTIPRETTPRVNQEEK